MTPIATQDLLDRGELVQPEKALDLRRLSETVTTNPRTNGALSAEHDHVLKTFRLLIADLCQQFNGGHPG